MIMMIIMNNSNSNTTTSARTNRCQFEVSVYGRQRRSNKVIWDLGKEGEGEGGRFTPAVARMFSIVYLFVVQKCRLVSCGKYGRMQVLLGPSYAMSLVPLFVFDVILP